MCDGCGELTETSRVYGMLLCEGCEDIYDRAERDYDSEDQGEETAETDK